MRKPLTARREYVIQYECNKFKKHNITTDGVKHRRFYSRYRSAQPTRFDIMYFRRDDFRETAIVMQSRNKFYSWNNMIDNISHTELWYR